METLTNKISRPKRPLIIELVGLAGSGKTTLARTLSQRHEKILVAADLALRNVEHMPIFASHAPGLLPLFLSPCPQSRWFTWDEMKAMVYLKGWPAVLGQQTTDNGMVILLDHGPIFKLATLHAFGPPRLQSSGFESWWQRMFKQWACTLDMIIWLEAPTELLVERINGRNQRHAVKGKAEGEAYDFLSHYQTAYEQILAKVSVYKAPTLLQFDTQQTPIEQIVDEILVTINDVSSIPSNI